MTTNITPIETIKKNLKIINHQVDAYIEDEYIEKALIEIDEAIAELDQALAPQKCDVTNTKSEFYINKAKEVIKMIGVRLNPNNQANTSNFLDNISEAFLFNQSVDSLLDAALKQLHSQQKTFTLEKIREIVFKFANYSFNKACMFDLKNLNNKNCKDCRECLLAEFEKEVK